VKKHFEDNESVIVVGKFGDTAITQGSENDHAEDVVNLEIIKAVDGLNNPTVSVTIGITNGTGSERHTMCTNRLGVDRPSCHEIYGPDGKNWEVQSHPVDDAVKEEEVKDTETKPADKEVKETETKPGVIEKAEPRK